MKGCLIFRGVCQLYSLQLRSVLYGKSSVADGLTRDEAQVVFAVNGLDSKGTGCTASTSGASMSRHFGFLTVKCH